jgi:hypothetical protein
MACCRGWTFVGRLTRRWRPTGLTDPPSAARGTRRHRPRVREPARPLPRGSRLRRRRSWPRHSLFVSRRARGLGPGRPAGRMASGSSARSMWVRRSPRFLYGVRSPIRTQRNIPRSSPDRSPARRLPRPRRPGGGRVVERDGEVRKEGVRAVRVKRRTAVRPSSVWASAVSRPGGQLSSAAPGGGNANERGPKWERSS